MDRFGSRVAHGLFWRRLVLLVLVLTIVVSGPARAEFFPEQEPKNSEIRFGCQPGPIEPFIHHDPPLPPARIPSEDEPLVEITLVVDGQISRGPIEGTGFNLEHTLWSCPSFRPSLRRRIVEPFMPSAARVDTGQLPLAPEDVPAEQLTWEHIHGLMSDRRYQPSWEFIRRLNRENIKVMLGVWGAPGAFNHDGTRRGALLPQYVDNYVDYYTAVVHYLVQIEGLSVWSATIMNEPDGGDGTYIPPELLVEVARRMGPSLAQYGVKLYGPDTASAENALAYLPLLMDEPDIMQHMAAIGTHQYYPSPYVERLIESVRAAGSDLPVYVTEYTSFHYGSLDRGQEATDEVGFMLDIANTAVSLYNDGVDSALLWDAVDYYQAGHAAITRWGLLQGPDEAFYPRKRYFGMLQILTYLQPGTEILSIYLTAAHDLTALAMRPPGDGQQDLAIALVNQGGPVLLEVSLLNIPDLRDSDLHVYVTDHDNDQRWVGQIDFSAGHGHVYLPPRSIVTLAAATAPDE